MKVTVSVSSCALRALAVVACAGSMCAVSRGQSVVIAGSDTGWVLAPAGGGVPDPYSFMVRSGTAADAGNDPSESHSTLAQTALARMGINGSVTHDGVGATDEFRYALSYQRDFRINTSATVTLSNMLDGLFTFSGGGGANNIPAFMTAEITVLRLNAQNQWVPTGIVSTINVNGTATNLPGQSGAQTVNNLLRLDGGNLDIAQGANYRVVARLLVGGSGLINTTPGSAVAVDTRTAPRAGQAASIAVMPLGYNGDSRAAVAAAGAAEYGVSGRNIRVGVIEGNAFAHASLGDRLVIRNGNLNANAQNSSEHALAVAGIIASASNNAQARGIAPEATIYSAAATTWPRGTDILADFMQQGVRVVNMSFGVPPGGGASDFDAQRINLWVTNNPSMTLVASAGNAGAPPQNGTTVGAPASANNVICVGAVNREFTRRADFSSYSAPGVGRRPDLVAPGEYILTAGTRDADGNGLDDEFRRTFVGTDFDYTNGPSTGDVSGTSFAAPMVTGAVALLQDFQRTHAAGHDADSTDSRVMKAILMNTATTSVQRTNGNAWAQDTTVYQMPGHPTLTTLGVDRSGDIQLGAGLLNVRRSLEMFARAEVRAADDATSQNMRIDITGGAAQPNIPMFWDRQEVRGAAQGALGTVEYTLGQANQGWHFRSTLAWIEENQSINGNLVVQYSRMQMWLYVDGTEEGNVAGFDPANPDADLMISGTFELSGVARMLDLTLPQTGNYYLLIADQFPRPQFGSNPMFGLSVYIPAPGGAAALAVFGVACAARRRRHG